MLMLCFYSKAQKTLIVSGNPYHFESVIKTDSAGKSILYSKGIEWFANTFRNSKVVIQAQDPTACFIIGKGDEISNPESNGVNYHVTYTLKLEFKDNRIKYTLYDFESPEYGEMKDGKITQYQIFFGHGTMDKIYSKLQNKSISINDLISSSLTRTFTQKLSNSNW